MEDGLECKYISVRTARFISWIRYLFERVYKSRVTLWMCTHCRHFRRTGPCIQTCRYRRVPCRYTRRCHTTVCPRDRRARPSLGWAAPFWALRINTVLQLSAGWGDSYLRLIIHDILIERRYSSLYSVAPPPSQWYFGEDTQKGYKRQGSKKDHSQR